MRRLFYICTLLGGGAASALSSGCTSVPPLSHVTNNLPFGPDISVDDIVKRVKCELADAMRTKMVEPNFRWLDSWTAKADLTLQVNEMSGLTPNATFIQPLKNVFPIGSGPSSVLYSTGQPGPTTAVNAITQSFNRGIGATYTGQVFRTETVSFALSLKELNGWREIGAGKTLPCIPVGTTDLQGNLDLGSWIDTALVPVEAGDLGIGIHPDPGTVVKPPSGGAPAAAQVKVTNPWILYYKDAAKNAAENAAKSAQLAWAAQRQAERSQILNTAVKKKIHELAENAASAAMYAQQAHQNADNVTDDQHVGDARENAVFADKNAEAAALDAAAANLAVNPNPPIDSLSHSLNFIVVAGASVSPNWVLLQWKGPANVGNAASI